MWVRWPRIPLSTANSVPSARCWARWFRRRITCSPGAYDRPPITHRAVEVELAGVGEDLPGEKVELVGFGSGTGEHQGRSVGAKRVPVGDRSLAECEAVVVEHDAAVCLVGGEGGGDVAVAELVEGRLLPCGLLTAVDGELGDAITEHVEGGSESSAGGDFGELVVIADEDQLGADPCHLIDDTGQVAHRGHAGLVDHDHRARVDVAVLDEMASKRGRVDPGAGFELAGGACRRCQADDREPGVLVQHPDDAEGVGLACSRPTDEDRDPIARRSQRPHCGCLVVAQRRRSDGSLDSAMIQEANTGVDAADELVDESFLEREQRPRRVGPSPIVGDHPTVGTGPTSNWGEWSPSGTTAGDPSARCTVASTTSTDVDAGSADATARVRSKRVNVPSWAVTR